MNKRIGLVAALALLLLAGAARASEPCGIYARIDKVEFEPNNVDKAERVKVWGDFILIKTGPPDNHKDVVRGIMYFEIVKGKEEHCRIEWKDLQEIANTTKYVAFGSAYSERNDKLGRGGNAGAQEPDVRTKDNLGNPIPYPLDHGIHRLRTTEVFGERNPVKMLQTYLEKHPLEKP